MNINYKKQQKTFTLNSILKKLFYCSFILFISYFLFNISKEINKLNKKNSCLQKNLEELKKPENTKEEFTKLASIDDINKAKEMCEKSKAECEGLVKLIQELLEKGECEKIKEVMDELKKDCEQLRLDCTRVNGYISSNTIVMNNLKPSIQELAAQYRKLKQEYEELEIRHNSVKEEPRKVKESMDVLREVENRIIREYEKYKECKESELKTLKKNYEREKKLATNFKEDILGIVDNWKEGKPSEAMKLEIEKIVQESLSKRDQ